MIRQRFGKEYQSGEELVLLRLHQGIQNTDTIITDNVNLEQLVEVQLIFLHIHLTDALPSSVI